MGFGWPLANERARMFALQGVVMGAFLRISALAIAALALVAAPLAADARPGARGGWHHHGHHGHHGWRHGGHFWSGIGFGLGLGVGTTYALSPWYHPGYVVTGPHPGYHDPGIAPAQPVARAPAEPIVYPNHGQTAAQTEADRQACDRWAMTQPSAMADASVFHRATLACMEGRGYTVK
jgi:hypothetical protein